MSAPASASAADLKFLISATQRLRQEFQIERGN
jgi:hypothetical protein